ncbi:MAG: hypothetical protein ACRCXZ_01725 [Patescibacteria group bacterium]
MFKVLHRTTDANKEPFFLRVHLLFTEEFFGIDSNSLFWNGWNSRILINSED